MGKINVADKELSTAFKPLRLKSAQDLMINRKSPTQFKLERKLQLPGSCTGIGVLKDGRLVLSYWGGTYLLLIHVDGQSQDGKIELAGKPWGVAVHPDTDDVYVTVPELEQVQVVNVQSKAIRKISCSRVVYGIALMNDKMALGGYGKLYITDLDGTTIVTVGVGSQNLYSIRTIKSSYCRSKESELFICETERDKIHIASFQNDCAEEMSIKHVLNLRRAVDSVCGLEDDMYVVCWGTNKLVRIEKDYAENEIVLQNGILQEPFALNFSMDYSNLTS